MLEYIQNSWSVLIVLEVLQQREGDMIVHVSKERSMNNESSCIEKGKYNLSLILAYKIAKALESDIEEVFIIQEE